MTVCLTTRFKETTGGLLWYGNVRYQTVVCEECKGSGRSRHVSRIMKGNIMTLGVTHLPNGWFTSQIV